MRCKSLEAVATLGGAFDGSGALDLDGSATASIPGEWHSVTTLATLNVRQQGVLRQLRVSTSL